MENKLIKHQEKLDGCVKTLPLGLIIDSREKKKDLKPSNKNVQCNANERLVFQFNPFTSFPLDALP
jgi:type IV secretory pathway VirD2 relaxase